MTTTSTPTITLHVTIDAARASLLCGTASPTAGWDLTDRFEVLTHDDERQLCLHSTVWAEGQIMWCPGVLEAMALADYESASGYANLLLWDLATGPEWPDGYAVLTSRPWHQRLP